MLIDVQNTFCIPDFELYVAGSSGHGAVEDNIRLCEFIYRNLGEITRITATMDTHTAMQIFHAIFLVDEDGNTRTLFADPRGGACRASGGSTPRWRPSCRHLARIRPANDDPLCRLEEKGKYALTIWPYHAMLGGIGHALVPSVEEAIFFHSHCAIAQTDFEIKGDATLYRKLFRHRARSADRSHGRDAGHA